jgi:alpha-mannosidase
MLEFGLNRYGYAIYSHSGDYTSGTQLGARMFNQPAAAFITDKHDGVLGSEYSFGTISNSDVIIRAIKKAENSDYIVVRVNEGADRNARNVKLKLGNGIVEACEVNAVEDEIGAATVENGSLVFDLAPYEVKSFAVKLADCKVATKAIQTNVELPYNADIVTFNHNRDSAVIPGINASIPGEIFPGTIECGGVSFKTGDIWGEGNNALICAGQQLNVSGKKFYFVGASLYGDKTYNFKVDGKLYPIKVQAINERIGKWDLYDLAEVANIKTDKLAWECTHTHGAHGDNVAAQLYFFMYELPIGETGIITLPEDSGLMILAATQTQEDTTTTLETALYDRVTDREFTYKMSSKEKRYHKKMKKKWKKTPNKS